MQKSILVGVLGLLLLGGPATAHAAEPVPSLTPDATRQLWTQLTQHPVAPSARDAGTCRPLRAVLYAQTDWLRLATTLAANPSQCAQYYISVPPVVADKTTFRTGQASKIRALGPNFHTLAEVNFTAWSKWVNTNATTWYAAGVEARRRMAAAGYDVTQGDTWVLNEASSGVRRGDGSSRQNLEEFVHGLYDGDGTTPPAQGAVFINGIAQSTADLSTYKQNLQSWLGDTTFWGAMSTYVTDWSQELYGDVREYAVAGATPKDRQTHLDAYLNHELALADAGPDSVATARTFLQSAYSPLANAAWSWTSAYGYTAVPYDGMEDYVSAQVDALRAADAGLAQDHFGFAWAPSNSTGLATADFNDQTGAILTRLAAAIHDSAETTGAACAATGCSYVVDGGAFTEAWRTFSTWSSTAVGFATAPVETTADTPSAPLAVQLAFGTLPQKAPADVPVELTTSSPVGGFSTSPDGPFTPTLAVTIPAGSANASFYYEDAQAGTPTITASTDAYGSVTQAETVDSAPAG